MSLHRAVNQKDRILLAQLTQAGIDMTLPLKGVPAKRIMKVKILPPLPFEFKEARVEQAFVVLNLGT